MSLIHDFEKQGNILFRYRGQIPIVIFVVCLPIIIFSGNYAMDGLCKWIVFAVSALTSLLGFALRIIAVGTTPDGTSGRNTQNQIAESLNTKGIYSVVRHPLYLGNFLMWLGILGFTFSVPLVIVLSFIYWFYYERIMFAEEAFLTEKYGMQYIDWSARVPAIIPAFKGFTSSENPFNLKKVLRQEYSGFLVMVFCYSFIDNLRFFLLYQTINPLRTSVVILVIALFITLLLRSLKYHSDLLK